MRTESILNYILTFVFAEMAVLATAYALALLFSNMVAFSGTRESLGSSTYAYFFVYSEVIASFIAGLLGGALIRRRSFLFAIIFGVLKTAVKAWFLPLVLSLSHFWIEAALGILLFFFGLELSGRIFRRLMKREACHPVWVMMMMVLLPVIIRLYTFLHSCR